MSINEILEKIKPYYTFILVVVIGSIFFALGKLSNVEANKTPIKIEYPSTTSFSESATVIKASTMTASVMGSDDVLGTSHGDGLPAQTGSVIGSKSGKKYYFPWCGTVKRIKPENQVHFASIDEAKKAGFTAGGNCKGLN